MEMNLEQGSTFSTLFDNVTDGVCISNGKGEILYINPAALRMLDLKAEKLPEIDFCKALCGRLSSSVCAEHESSCPLRKGNDERTAVSLSGTHTLTDGYRWVQERIRSIKRTRDLKVRCLKMPISHPEGDVEEKHFTLLEDASAEKELARLADDWRNMVVHDLRSPLTNILGALMALADIPADKPMDANDRAILEIGIRSGKRMLELLNDHLDLAKLDAGMMTVELETVPLSVLTESCALEQAAAAAAKGIQVTQSVPADLMVKADTGLLRRIVENILNNAIKFTPTGGRVEISASAARGMVLCSIKDTGIGIDPAEVDHLFDRYHQAQARRQGRIQGTGLGLAFCLEALKAMHGDIHVASKLGVGSTFTIRLPQAK